MVSYKLAIGVLSFCFVIFVFCFLQAVEAEKGYGWIIIHFLLPPKLEIRFLFKTWDDD